MKYLKPPPPPKIFEEELISTKRRREHRVIRLILGLGTLLVLWIISKYVK